MEKERNIRKLIGWNRKKNKIQIIQGSSLVESVFKECIRTVAVPHSKFTAFKYYSGWYNINRVYFFFFVCFFIIIIIHLVLSGVECGSDDGINRRRC